MAKDIDIIQIVIRIGEQEVVLTPEEARKLEDVLRSIRLKYHFNGITHILPDNTNVSYTVERD